MDKPKITIIGKRWFDKQTGNTYHSAEVHVDGKYLWKVPYRYGYGEQYLQTGFEILLEHHIYPSTPGTMEADFADFMKEVRQDRSRFMFIVSDVDKRENL